jgi:hypothetical protein
MTRPATGLILPERRSDIAAYLDKLKPQVSQPRGLAGGSGPRLILALDATASREPTWDRACHVTHVLFDAVTRLNPGNPDGLVVQLVYYRGYDECRASRWVGAAAALRGLMAQVRCQGGITQIGAVLRHALGEVHKHPVGAVLFIGDAVEEDPETLFPLARSLGERATPLFMLHEGGNPVVADTFGALARLSGGAYLPFDLAAIDRLKALLGGIAAYAAGGLAALEWYADSTDPATVRHISRQLRLPK